MRYIIKSTVEPACLSEYKQECANLRVPRPYLYKDFNRTGELKDVLCREQHNVCCYCQRKVKGYRIEHLYPENNPKNLALSQSLQLDYNNLFAACIDSSNNPPKLQYCDVAKGNHLIREFIKDQSCSQFFTYNLSGEILPVGLLNTWKQYLESTSLSGDILDARETIKTLNLNCHTLVEKRKVCLDSLYKLLPKRSKEEWQELVEIWKTDETYCDFIELRIEHIERYFSKKEQL